MANNLATAAQIEHAPHPIQFRLPKPHRGGHRPDVDPWFGLNRSAWNALILPTDQNGNKPPVKSICIKKRGAARGLRLVIWDSAKAYFDKLTAEQCGQEKEAA